MSCRGEGVADENGICVWWIKGVVDVNGKRLSNAEFARLWADRSITTDEIGRRLGITKQAVSQRARARGLPQRDGHQKFKRAIPPERDSEFRALWEARISVAEMCRILGCKEWNIRQHAARLGYPPRSKGWRPYAADPNQVRRLYDAGLCWGDIAKATCANERAIRCMAYRLGLKRYKGWKPSLTHAQWRKDQLAELMRIDVDHWSAT